MCQRQPAAGCCAVINNPAKRLAMKIISIVVFVLVFMNMMTAPASSDPGRDKPMPD